MPTRTIRLESDAYERLRSAKRPGESFSDAVRRAVFPDVRPPPTGADLLAYYRRGGSGVSEEYLNAVEKAAESDRPPDEPWA